MRPYEKLSQLYAKDWGNFSYKYIDFILNIINKFNLNIQSILDVGCGTGALASELHKRDYNVSGIDISYEMIEIARKNSKEIDFQVDDMSEFILNKRFQLIISSFNAINYLICDAKIKKTLKNIFSHLDNGGIFIFDINSPVLYEERHFGTIDREFEEIKFKQILEYNKTTKIAKTIFHFGNNEQETHIQKAYSDNDMDKYLLDTGFKIIGKYKDLNLSPIDNKTYKIFYVVKKKD